jgi:hypothetical protein
VALEMKDSGRRLAVVGGQALFDLHPQPSTSTTSSPSDDSSKGSSAASNKRKRGSASTEGSSPPRKKQRHNDDSGGTPRPKSNAGAKDGTGNTATPQADHNTPVPTIEDDDVEASYDGSEKDYEATPVVAQPQSQPLTPQGDDDANVTIHTAASSDNSLFNSPKTPKAGNIPVLDGAGSVSPRSAKRSAGGDAYSQPHQPKKRSTLSHRLDGAGDEDEDDNPLAGWRMQRLDDEEWMRLAKFCRALVG